MKTIHGMTLKSFFPVFLGAMIFFILILQLVDLFANLWRYINNDVSMAQIGMVVLYYIPKCISYSIPIATLFSISFCIGTFHANNELIAIFGSGIPLTRFIVPLILFSIVASIGGFYFDDRIVIETYQKKNELSRQLLNESQSLSRSRPTVLDDNNRIIYHAEYYNHNSGKLSNLTIVSRNERGRLVSRIDAEWAEWEVDHWKLYNSRIFNMDEETNKIVELKENILDDPVFTASPERFKKTVLNVEEMPVSDAREWIDSLIKSGLPYREPLTDYYKRFSFALTPLIVALISSAMGGRYKKNILLMSLLTSLSISVVYYVFQMVTVILSNNGYLTPLAGAWSPFIFFTISSIFLFRFTRT
ncbi:MAG: LptF/LptG family permease [Spirochaetales bacterium]|nr:LptF/LptG family permease [Spirochaetales bacterium]